MSLRWVREMVMKGKEGDGGEVGLACGDGE